MESVWSALVAVVLASVLAQAQLQANVDDDVLQNHISKYDDQLQESSGLLDRQLDQLFEDDALATEANSISMVELDSEKYGRLSSLDNLIEDASNFVDGKPASRRTKHKHKLRHGHSHRVRRRQRTLHKHHATQMRFRQVAAAHPDRSLDDFLRQADTLAKKLRVSDDAHVHQHEAMDDLFDESELNELSTEKADVPLAEEHKTTKKTQSKSRKVKKAKTAKKAKKAKTAKKAAKKVKETKSTKKAKKSKKNKTKNHPKAIKGKTHGVTKASKTNKRTNKSAKAKATQKGKQKKAKKTKKTKKAQKAKKSKKAQKAQKAKPTKKTKKAKQTKKKKKPNKTQKTKKLKKTKRTKTTETKKPASHSQVKKTKQKKPPKSTASPLASLANYANTLSEGYAPPQRQVLQAQPQAQVSPASPPSVTPRPSAASAENPQLQTGAVPAPVASASIAPVQMPQYPVAANSQEGAIFDSLFKSVDTQAKAELPQAAPKKSLGEKMQQQSSKLVASASAGPSPVKSIFKSMFH